MGQQLIKTIRTMKTIKAFSAALIVLAATACNSDYINESATANNLEPMTISGIETKTVFTPSADGGSVAWTAGDKIAVFDNLGGKNTFTNSENATASFSGNVTSGTTAFWAIYPEELVKDFSNTSAIITLPSDQTIAAGTFAEDLNISAANGFKTPGTPEVDGITFSNVCAMVSFELPARIDARKVTFTASNREIAGDLKVNCEEFTASVAANGSKSVSMTGDFPAGSRFYFVIAPGVIEGFRIDVETEKGSAYYKSASSAALNTVAGKLINLPVIDFTEGVATATGSHIYDNGTLTGSAVAVNHGIPENMWADVTAISVTVQKGGQTYRTYSADSVNAATVNPSAGNVYLPQGTYDVNIAYTMNGVETTANSAVTLPAPAEFAVNVTGTTSYSLYKASNVSGANGHDARTISSPSASISGISAAVLAEYPASYAFTLNGNSSEGTSSNTSFSTADFTGLANGTHSLSCSVTFDGVTASGKTTCEITGLPCSFNFYDNKDAAANSGWFLNNVSWSTGTDGSKCSIFDSGKDGNLISPQFHTPDDINVSCSAEAQYYVALTSPSSHKIELRVGATNSSSTVASKYTVHSISGNNTTGKKFSTYTTSLTVSSSNSHISFHHNSPSQPKGLFSIKAQWWYLNLGNVTVNYR